MDRRAAGGLTEPTVPKPKPIRPTAKHERGWHEGSVREVRPGVWRAWRPRAQQPDGARSRPSRTFSGPDAEQRAKTWAKGDVEPVVLLLGHWLDRWLALRLPLVRYQTARNYRTFVGLCAPLASRPLAQLTPDDWQALTNELLKTRARSSVKVWRAIISSALKAAVPRHLSANPMSAVRLPTADQRPVKAWRRDEVRRLLAAAEGRAHECWLWLSIGTGIRLGESRALLWSDVDLQARTIVVSKSLDHQTDREGPTKSGKTRIVDLPDEVIPVLVEQRARQRPGERRVCVSAWSGRLPDPKTIQGWLRRLTLDIGVSPLSPHSTRHTCASLMLASGVPVTEVAQMLGHSSPSITMQVYAHFIQQGERRAAAAIGAVLGQAAEPIRLGEAASE